MRQATRFAGAFIAGALAPLSFSPVDFWPAGLLSLLGLLFLLEGRSPGQAARLGWVYGLGFFGVGVSWIYVSIEVYGNAGPLLAGFLTLALVAGLALLFSLQCALSRRWFSRGPPSPEKAGAVPSPALGFAALWVLFEWIRGWLLTGFPWLYLGYAHLATPLAGLAPVFGVLGISFAVALSAALLYGLGRRMLEGNFNVRRALPALAGLLALWLIPALLAQVEWVRERPETRSVGLVQANIDQDLKFDRAYLEESLALYERLSAPLWPRHDLVLWPETAIPLLYEQAGGVLDHFDAQARAGGAALVTGILSRPDADVHNSIVSVGEGSGLYHKQRLVPFGEYVPLEGLLEGLLEIFELPMSSLRPGPAGQALLEAGDLRLAPYICYEVVYPDFVRATSRGADLLVTISNDTWFGRSWGPLQHLQMAAMRALENGRYMIRATNNGVTAIIDEKGRVRARSPQFEAAVLEGEIRLFEGRTPFSRWGSWPVVGLLFLVLAFTGWKSRATRTRS